MNEQSQERFNLNEFVLGYLEEAGSIVMPPEFGVYDVLMPDEVADSLALEDHTRFAFEGRGQNGRTDDAMQLGVSHPLVEQLAHTLTEQPVNLRTYIRGVRTDKRGLAELARQHFDLPNARIDEVPQTRNGKQPHATERAAQHHYLLCNFKVTFISEEKQEELLSVIMDVQAGHAVADEALLQRLATLDTEPAYEGLPIAPPRWRESSDALAPETLQALLPRAEAALRKRLADQSTALAVRMERHLSLDLARIGDYYDEMAADLQKRRARLAEDDERRQDLADKLAMLEAERVTKLADATGRYKLRVEMKLVNVLLATQPKVVLPMSISNRTANITRTVVWDPLRHQLEPLVCDVCGEPGEGLHLCTGGHLAHEACLAPQCVDCKREFCQLCAAQIGECVVCHRPVCRPSLINCPTCGRGTCSEHQQLCHAADGQPAVLPTTEESPAAAPAAATAEVKPPPAKTPPAKPPAPSANRRQGKSTARSKSGKSSAASKRTSAKTAPTTPIVKGVRMDVQIYEDRPLIVAFVMKSTNRVLATRSFELTPKGILLHCDCEKSPCPADGYYYRPHPVTIIAKQIALKLQEFQKEYLIPAKKVKYLYQRYGQIREEKQFVLSGFWRDQEKLSEAMRGFDEMAG